VSVVRKQSGADHLFTDGFYDVSAEAKRRGEKRKKSPRAARLFIGLFPWRQAAKRGAARRDALGPEKVAQLHGAATLGD
jgi:hypothetical protein